MQQRKSLMTKNGNIIQFPEKSDPEEEASLKHMGVLMEQLQNCIDGIGLDLTLELILLAYINFGRHLNVDREVMRYRIEDFLKTTFDETLDIWDQNYEGDQYD